jgi:hypothetical protein
MKVLIVCICFLVTGCATGVSSLTSGDQSKNGSPMRFERLGSMTSEDIATGRHCPGNMVKVCTTSSRFEDCDCMFVRDAEFRTQPVARQHRIDSRRGHR